MFNTYHNRHIIARAILLVTYLIIFHSANAKAQYITIPQSTSHDNTSGNYYPEELLKLALKKTEMSDGKADVRFFPYITGRERLRAILKNNLGLDVIWSASTKQREEQLLSVKFNLLQGINEYKILLIRSSDQEKFSNVKTLTDLRNFKAGTGTHWQDTQILTLNEMPFVTSWDYEPMFKMLAAKRFDYMIRNATEIWNEVQLHNNLNLMAEKTLLLHYEQNMFYFVRKENTQLADRILRGLNLALADGSLDILLKSVPGNRIALEEIQKKQRIFLELNTSE
jgi:hypothetical protein